MFDIILRVVAGLVAAGGFFAAFRSFKLWQSSRAEWTLLAVAGGCLVGVIGGIYSLRIFAVLLFIVAGMLVTWSFERKERKAWRQRAMGGLATLLLLFSLSMILRNTFDCKGQKLQQQAVARQMAYNYAGGLGMGKYLEANFAGAKVVIISPLDDYTKESIRGIEDGVRTVDLVIQDAASPSSSPEEQEVVMMGGDGMLTVERLEDVLTLNEDAELVVTLAGLPWDFAESDYAPNDDQVTFLKKRIAENGGKPVPVAQVVNDNEKEYKAQKVLKPMPPVIIMGGSTIPKLGGFVRAGVVHGIQMRRSDYIYDEKAPVPTDFDAAYSELFIMITAANMDSVGDDYAYIFAE